MIYCGCCPWVRCPNIKPTIDPLHDMGFTRVKAVYLADSFKTDWIDHGYPDLYRVDLARGGVQKVSGGSAKTDFGWLVDSRGALIGQSEYEMRSGHWQLVGATDGRNVLAEAADPLAEHELRGLMDRASTDTGDASLCCATQPHRPKKRQSPASRARRFHSLGE